MSACFGVGLSSPSFVRNNNNNYRCRIIRSEGNYVDSVSKVVNPNGASSVVGEKENLQFSKDEKRSNGLLLVSDEAKENISSKKLRAEKLEPFWDDGYGTVTVKDYFDASKDFVNHPDAGPPRWFCPLASASPLKGSPILMFLPGMDGTGWGLILHHKALGKGFEVRCLHIPVQDRTPFEGLVKLVEETIRLEHASSPNKPIYLVGDSFGGCLALAVASRNPQIDLVLILVNPATSFGRSPLQPLFPLLGAIPEALHGTVPYLLSFVMGDPVKMATVNVESKIPPMQQLEKVSLNLTALLPYLSDLASIVPKDTLLWKLKLLKSAAAYANSRLHAVKAEVLVLASGKDNMVPSEDEARRLVRSLQNCTARYFKENGHTLLLEDGIGLMTIIRGTCKYRRSKRLDFASDYIPPSLTEFKYAFNQVTGLLHFLTGPTMFSTLEDGTIVKGLVGVPNEGPVLLVGYHNFLGIELSPLVEEFMREKNIVVRGLAHPMLFFGKLELRVPEFSMLDWLKVFGAVPVAASNLFKLFSEKSHILLYPGGAREALHDKGEEYKLFWPEQQEFVRMAAHFGATIVPFGAVGEEDLAQMLLDYNDLKNIPIVNDYIRDKDPNSYRGRDMNSREVVDQDMFFPVLLPKMPGRLYYLFGKPIETRGKKEILRDKKNANELYIQIKSEVERCLAYLIKKREEDPYRNLIDRTVHKALYASQREVPTFDP